MQAALFISQLPPPNPNTVPLPPGLNQLPSLEGLSANASETLTRATIAAWDKSWGNYSTYGEQGFERV